MPLSAVALRLKQLLSPSAPAAGSVALYPKADSKWYSQDSAALETLASQEFPMLAPVRASTTYTNITQSGLQTVDGVALAAGNRVLCRGQAGGLPNGIWIASAGAWTRAPDADTAAKIARGTQVAVLEGTNDRGKVFTQLMTVTTLGTDANHWRVATMIDAAGSLQYPPAAVDGSVFYDRNAKALAAFNGSVWTRLNGTIICTSTTRPAFTGDDAVIYETDTGNAYIYSGGSWVPFGTLAIEDENTALTNASKLDFQGAGVTVTNPNPGEAIVTIPGSAGSSTLPTGSWPKEIVRVVDTSASVPTSAAPSTVDGVALAVTDRVLKAIPGGSTLNGIYTVTTVGTGANGVWARATDSSTSAQLAGAAVAVALGTVNGGTRWSTSFKSTDVLGTTAMSWYADTAPAWRALTRTAGDITMSTSAVVIPFNGDNGGNNMTFDGAGRLTVVTPGMYYASTSLTFQQTGGSGVIWHQVDLIQRRGGTAIQDRQQVGSTAPSQYGSVTASGAFLCLAGDTFEAAVACAFASLSVANNNRCQLNAYRIGGLT
jgi:hypothetical protein